MMVLPHIGHDLDLPAGAAEGPTGTALGAGDDRFAHRRSMLQ